MFPKPHRQPQFTLQLVCEDRVLFVSVDLHVSLCSQQHPKCERAIRLLYPNFFCQLRSSSDLTNKNKTYFDLEVQTAASRYPFRIRHMFIWISFPQRRIISHQKYWLFPMCQSFWLQIQRSRVRFPALPDFLNSNGSGTGSTQPREVNWGATWIKSNGSGPENRD